ncbi:TRAP transporter substrate-binding protein [Bordetella hinzii]|uniref:C4-dicarboxylate ABC transporter substrate-binding protein n=2 Tax=Bordetella hinzii TaxID=103855 RepID=A0AAN1S0Q0_9BORD|nr:TRAP transporter substrate-binding protein [Bordetella hinzii]AKQ55514.1 2,3-diketo-L-gulonate-binding periplasmic protein YiaO precursor [Bordetella hinzii]AKQ60016.1 2,3-diketo-L-gulonate-binding periplasmic protein YiaO precursor [Bordetella hinzii]AZW18892.1 C4-dicarboxylate ABC transporter substrate-binding protein [Bordetella hinzii]KCB24268.1 ABC transporter, substrate-binding protein, family 7 [Bordetella hinzii OH87 BAL007II]KCB30117.1 ABC transporter, substrate-binding protein, fa
MYKKLSLLAGTIVLAFSAGAQAQTKWDLPTAYPASNLHVENLTQFVKEVDELSGGKLKITLHNNASLYKAPEIKRAVQGNQAQIGEILLSNFANEDPIYELDGLPFLATGYDASFKLYQAQKPFLEKKLNSQGMTLLYAVAWPPQGIFANRDIKKVSDMKGLKWRAYSPVTAKIAELAGAQPVTVQQAELAQAMATGVIDSYMSSGSTGYDTKTYEYIKKFYDTEAWLPKNAVIVNKKAFDALDPATQEALKKAGAQAEARGWKLSQEKNAWYKEALTKNGMEIVKPTVELKEGLGVIGKRMLDDWLKKAGADGQAMIAEFRKP